MINCENCVGDMLVNCKNCFACFDVHGSQDCMYMTDCWRTKDSLDIVFQTEPNFAMKAFHSDSEVITAISVILYAEVPIANIANFALIVRIALDASVYKIKNFIY